jgi:hypothetical protein
MNNFLPDNYEVPSANDKYMKWQKGENRFRILSSPILGYEWWTEEGDKRVPKRIPLGQAIPTQDIEDPESIKHFWAMVVYNYVNKKVQILEITQKGIQKTLRALAKDEDWGSPVQKYDIVVTKTGDGMETKYEVLPKPASKMEDGIIELYEDMGIDLTALYRGDDPYEGKPDALDIDEVSKGIDQLRSTVQKVRTV